MLFIDIDRDGKVYAVEIFQRPRDPSTPYQVKLTSKSNPETTYKQNFKSLGNDSYNIRERIWNHLQISKIGDKISEITFDEEDHDVRCDDVAAIEK